MDNLNMNSSDQDSDLPAGFLIKDKNGRFKKIEDDEITDFAVKKQPVPESIQPARSPIAPPSLAVPVRQALPVKPPPPISSSPTASTFMAPDDELEIRAEQKKLETIMASPAGHSVLSVEEIVNKVIGDFRLSFSDDVMQKRFSKVIESRLRDLRDSVETKEVLTRSKKIGGLEILPDQAERILSFVDKHISEKPNIKPIEPVAASKPNRDIPPAFIPRPQPKKPPLTEIPPKPITADEDMGQLAEEIKKEMQVPVPSPKIIPSNPVASAVEQKPRPVMPSAPAPVSTPEMYTRPADEMPRIVQVRMPEQERPQVNDIRQPAKVMGPVEELADIDLDEFRRQGTNPTEAADRILEKIDLLEHDSWTMKIEAIKAWRRSSANQLYIQIGRESMDTNQSVAEVIRKRMQNNQSYLLLDEFLAINSLNSRLAI
ncbi:MAG: hypothetical protein WCT27_03270 [Patescibacteria group bacterium]